MNIELLIAILATILSVAGWFTAWINKETLNVALSERDSLEENCREAKNQMSRHFAAMREKQIETNKNLEDAQQTFVSLRDELIATNYQNGKLRNALHRSHLQIRNLVNQAQEVKPRGTISKVNYQNLQDAIRNAVHLVSKPEQKGGDA